MVTNSETFRPDGKVLWHIELALTYDGGVNDSCEEGVGKIRKALIPLMVNGTGVRQIFITSLPKKE